MSRLPSHPGCSCRCCGVLVALGGKDLLVMLLIENVSALLMMLKDCCCQSRSTFRCCVVCISQLPLPLPLLDRVPVVAVAMVFQLRLEGGRHGDKDVNGGRVDIIDAAKGLLSKPNKQTRVSRL